MAVTKKEPVKTLANYKNTGKVNLFTEAGRCPPNGIVALYAEQAITYKGLEKCAK